MELILSSRREFGRSVQVQIIKRASDSLGFARCELCGVICKKFIIDHFSPDAMQINKDKALTAGEGQLLCYPCNKEKTKKDISDIAKVKRQEASHLGANTPKRKIQNRGFSKPEKSMRPQKEKIPPRPLYS